MYLNANSMLGKRQTGSHSEDAQILNKPKWRDVHLVCCVNSLHMKCGIIYSQVVFF